MKNIFCLITALLLSGYLFAQPVPSRAEAAGNWQVIAVDAPTLLQYDMQTKKMTLASSFQKSIDADASGVSKKTIKDLENMLPSILAKNFLKIELDNNYQLLIDEKKSKGIYGVFNSSFTLSPNSDEEKFLDFVMGYGYNAGIKFLDSKVENIIWAARKTLNGDTTLILHSQSLTIGNFPFVCTYFFSKSIEKKEGFPKEVSKEADIKKREQTNVNSTFTNPERRQIQVQSNTLFRKIELFSEGLASFSYGEESYLEKWGCIDTSGKVVIQPKYDYVGNFSGGLAPAKLDEQYGFIDKFGALKIPFAWHSAGSFVDGLAQVYNGDKYGYIDHAGKLAIDLLYERAYDFSEGMAVVANNKKWGFIDTEGKQIIPMQYDQVSSFHEGLASVKIDNKYGFIDKSGKLVIAPKYDGTFMFAEGLAQIKLKGKYGFVNGKGEEVVPIKYDDAGLRFENGCVIVSLNNKEFLINLNGVELTTLKYDRIIKFSEGLAEVHTNDKRGFINQQGEEIVAAKYLIVSKFSYGLAAVYVNGKWGYINKTGELVIPVKYDKAGDFLGGLAAVSIGAQKFTINKTGQKVIPKIL